LTGLFIIPVIFSSYRLQYPLGLAVTGFDQVLNGLPEPVPFFADYFFG